MEKGTIGILTVLLVCFMTISCNAKNENRSSKEKAAELIEVFYNSRKQTYFEAIEIKKTNTDILVTVQYSNSKNSYLGKEKNNEIIVELEKGRELHLYKNGENELRVYKVVKDEYQPEDIEWTFYKNMSGDQL